MLLTRLKLKNWRNFRDVDVALGPRGYLIGANASGKSNLVDVFRFLRTIAQSEGGGLQKAIKERGGLGKLRSLHARKDPELRIEVELAESANEAVPRWRYVLAFKSEGKGQQRVLITQEKVWCEGKPVLSRPNTDDETDPARVTQSISNRSTTTRRFASWPSISQLPLTCTWCRSCSSTATKSPAAW